jgi:hypothetical protein
MYCAKEILHLAVYSNVEGTSLAFCNIRYRIFHLNSLNFRDKMATWE